MEQKYERYSLDMKRLVYMMNECNYIPLTLAFGNTLAHVTNLPTSTLFRETILNTHSRFGQPSIFLSRSLSRCQCVHSHIFPCQSILSYLFSRYKSLGVWTSIFCLHVISMRFVKYCNFFRHNISFAHSLASKIEFYILKNLSKKH